MLEKFKQTKFYIGWLKLKKDLEPMTFSQKVEHIWMYYKYYLVVVFLVGFTLSITATMLVSRSKEILVSGIMVNIYHNIDEASKKYGMEGNYVAGANIAGFLKVLNAMEAQGIV